jgi:hypothetical protein
MYRMPANLLPAAGLLLILAGAACAPATEPPVPGPAVDSGPTSGFVTVSGTRLMVDGRSHHFVGANFWYGMNLASPGPGGTGSGWTGNWTCCAVWGSPTCG